MFRRSALGLALALTLASGCYDDHGRRDDGGSTPGEDAGAVLDGGVATAPCTTVCEPARVLARMTLDVSSSRVPAVLDAVVHRDELVISLLVGAFGGADPTPEFSLARISRRTGEARIEVVDVRTSTGSIGAAALASRGETLVLIAAFSDRPFVYLQPQVRTTTWEGAAPTPTSFLRMLTDEPLPRCAGCFRRGASVAIGENGGLVTLAGEGVLHVGRVGLDDETFVRETIAVPSLLPNTALEARGDRSGSGVLVLGGLREAPGATATPALAMIATESALDPPISVPGASSDPVPHPWMHDGALELVRFQHDDGFSSGRLHRYAIEGSGTTELGTIETAGDLPPLVMASTPSTLLWAESSLTVIGESDLRVLVPPPGTCERVTPESRVHLPTPLAVWDPRVMVATEADGHTYVALLEQEPGARDTVVLVVFDLGLCRDTT